MDPVAQDGSSSRRSGGRGRDQLRRRAIVVAAGELMMEGGLNAATVEAIARRAGVSKQTIYNWWPSRGAVAMEGFMTVADPIAELPDEPTAAEALEILVGALVRLFTETPAGSLMKGLIAEAQSQPEIARSLQEQWLAPRREAAAVYLRRGMASGELRDDLDVEVTTDQIFAPFYYRLLLEHEPLSHAFAQTLLQQVLDGIRTRE